MIYHAPFQRYFNCKNPQIQNFIKVQVAPLKKLKIQNNKKMVFVIFLSALYDRKKKGKFDHRSHFAFQAPYITTLILPNFY